MMLSAKLLPDGAESNIEDILLILAGLAATVAAMHRKAPLGRLLRWLWRRNIGEPVSGWARAIITDTVEPMIGASRAEIMAAARTQHEQQNAKLDAIDGRVTALEQAARRPPTARTRKDDPT